MRDAIVFPFTTRRILVGRDISLKALEYAPDVIAVSDRLREVQREIDDLQLQIAQEEVRRPLITKDVVKYWLGRYRDLDVTDDRLCREMVETFIEKIELRNREALIFYNVSDSEKGSDTVRLLEFSSLNPNLEQFRVSSDSPVFILFPYAVVRVTL